MKIDTSAMHIYSIQRPQAQAAPRDAQAVDVPRLNQFSQARFADLLSTEEKSYIVKNFKTESANKINTPQLGRFLDVVA